MTLAGPASGHDQPLSPRSGTVGTPAPESASVLLLGADALLMARPATPVQLAHAGARAGYATVLPASWGDELIARFVMSRLSERAPGPAVQCSCPLVAHRLLTVGRDLEPVLVSTVSPPVALARYVRVLFGAAARITYVGACPGAIDESIDVRILPSAFLTMLAGQQISLDAQPSVYESVIPPDRRRFWSQPGGVPRVEALWTEAGGRTLMEVFNDDFAGELAQTLLSGKNALIDAGPRLGCACAGAISGIDARVSRATLSELEPPQAPTPLVDPTVALELELPLPAATRAPIDAARPADRPRAGRAISPAPVTADGRRTPSDGFRVSPTSSRLVVGGLPTARKSDKVRSLPRTYIARKRSSPKGLRRSEVMPEADDLAPPRPSDAPAARDDPPTAIRVPLAGGAPSFHLTPAQLGALIGGTAAVIVLLIVVGVFIGRELAR